jgi:glycosyltransferase involved in cell wall biosynthesis
MNVLVLCTDDNLGAGKAAYRITKALSNGSNKCRLVVKNKTISDSLVAQVKFNTLEKIVAKIRSFSFRLWKLKLDPAYYFFGYRYENMRVSQIINATGFVPDLIILTWISGFVSPSLISQLTERTKAKVIAYPLDMSLYTGGCHYAWQCPGYMQQCYNCPAILTPDKKNYSHIILKDKIRNFRNAGVSVIAATHALLEEAKKSTLFGKQTEIPKVLLPIDADIFNADSREFAKRIFKIPVQNISILYGATFSNEKRNEKRKGISHFLESLDILSNSLDAESVARINIIIVGKSENPEIISRIPFKVIFIDYIKDDLLLSMLYQASDVFVSSSVQDSGPMMVNEALMCGTPVVAFDIGVASDLIVNGESGYRVEKGNAHKIAEALRDLIDQYHANRINNVMISDKAKKLTSMDIFDETFLSSLKLLNM